MSRIINPICKRCGGMDRRWMQAHRHHAGMTMHRLCCCKKKRMRCEEGAILGVTLSGVDAAMCTACGIGNRSNTFLGVDGYYEVPYLSGTTTCTFRACFDLGTPVAIATQYENEGCTGALFECSTSHVRIEVVVRNDTQLIQRINVRAAGEDYAANCPASTLGNFMPCPEGETPAALSISAAFEAGTSAGPLNKAFGEEIENLDGGTEGELRDCSEQLGIAKSDGGVAVVEVVA